MDSLVRLQITNLFKRYDYLLTEAKIKREISRISHNIFSETVERVVERDSRLKDIFGDGPEQPDGDGAIPVVEDDEVKKGTDALRGIYRDIAKLTHPDKVANSFLNGLYIEATDHFHAGDDIGLYRVALVLGLEPEISESVTDRVRDQIEALERQIKFLESSYHMRWHLSDRQTKMRLVAEYIEKKLLRLSEA